MFKILLFRKLKPIFIFVVLMTGISFNALLYAQTPPLAPYANGNSITIGTASGEYPWTNNIIYGGSVSGTLNSTDLTVSNTISGDQSRKVIGGSAAGVIAVNTKVTYNGNRNYDINSISVANDPGIQVGHLWGGSNAGTVGQSQVVINSGRVRYYVLGGSDGSGGSTIGNTSVEINEVLVGFPPTLPENNGQGEVYGGSLGSLNVVTGDTYIKITGNIYNPATYSAGDPVTLIRQHVCGGGGGASPLVQGNTLIEISGGTIYGMVCGGSGGNDGKVNGNTVVNISGGQIREDAEGVNGGNVYGGSFRGFNMVTGGGETNTVLGNTAVNIFGNAFIQGIVCGGGENTDLYATSVVNGNATVTIEDGLIGGNIYAGGEAGASNVNQIATVILKNMDSSNRFASDFNRRILTGSVGVSGKANMVFDNYTAPNKAIIGATAGAFDTLIFKNNSTLIIDPTSNYYSKNWIIQTGSSVEFTANTNTSTTTETFSSGGIVKFGDQNNPASPKLLLNLRGNYIALENGTLGMKAVSNMSKDYLSIAGTAKKDNGNSTKIRLNLDPLWNGSRIDLVQALDAGSDIDVFVMDNLPVIPGRTVEFKSEVNGTNRIWYIEASCLPFVATISGPDSGCPEMEYIFMSNGTSNDMDYVWSVTNGTIAWGQGTHAIGATFTQSGTITLVYKNQSGCESGQAAYGISIDDITPTPVITGPAITYVGVSTDYQGDGDTNNATGYYWETGAGSILDGQGTNEASISWSAPGTDVIRLTYSLEACQGTGTLDIQILDQENLVHGDFTVNNMIQCFTVNDYAFTNTTVITPPNELLGYLWNFGDGSTSTEVNPIYKYTKGGVFGVTLITYGTIVDDTITKIVKVLSPLVERPSDQTVCANNPASDVIFNGNSNNYTWRNSLWIGLEDGSDPIRIPSFVTKNNTSNSVTDTITITPMLTENNLVCYGDTVKFRIIVNPLNVPTITGDGDACSNSEVTYITESGMSGYEWNVTGGQVIAGGASANHSVLIRWNSPGQGSVSVNYTNKTGCRATESTTKTVVLQEKVTITGQPASNLVLCSGEAFNLEVTASGSELTYQWYLNGSVITGATGATYTVSSGKPSDSGDYVVVVTGACNSVQSNVAEVKVEIEDIVVQKWENVLAVKGVPSENGGYEFDSFQWYENGNLMQGETKSYLYVSGEIDYSAVYVVGLTTTTGSTFYTCGRTFIPKNQVLVNPYPNPVGKGQTLTVDISGVPDNAEVEWILTDYKGLVLQKQPLKGNQAVIAMPNVSGIYILCVDIATAEPESKYFKIIVN